MDVATHGGRFPAVAAQGFYHSLAEIALTSVDGGHCGCPLMADSPGSQCSLKASDGYAAQLADDRLAAPAQMGSDGQERTAAIAL